MSFAVVRPLLRQSAVRTSTRSSGRRLESTTTKAAETAKDTASKAQQMASEYQAKASQGLSRVTSAAGPAIAGAAKGVSNALGRVGGRTGRLIGFVERQIPLAIYYSRVGLELSKMVFRGQSMSPPSVSTFQTYFNRIWGRVRNPSALVESVSSTPPASVLQQARNLSRTQVIAGGVIAAECLGFFTVGEMLGRFKLVGYHGDNGAGHH